MHAAWMDVMSTFVHLKSWGQLTMELWGKLHELTNRLLVDKTDPVIMFDKVQTLYMKYMDGIAVEVATSLTIGAVCRNLLC